MFYIVSFPNSRAMEATTDIADGLRMIGPFKTDGDADDYADKNLLGDWRLVELSVQPQNSMQIAVVPPKE
jgi:hypothetical protein